MTLEEFKYIKERIQFHLEELSYWRDCYSLTYSEKELHTRVKLQNELIYLYSGFYENNYGLYGENYYKKYLKEPDYVLE